MKSPRTVLLLKAMCWLVIGGFSIGSLGMHRFLAWAAQPDSGIWCGNSITDPLAALLNIGAPLGVAAAGVLAILRWRSVAAAWTVICGALVVITCTAWLLFIGIRFFQALPGFYLSSIVWWMRPIGELFGA